MKSESNSDQPTFGRAIEVAVSGMDGRLVSLPLTLADEHRDVQVSVSGTALGMLATTAESAVVNQLSACFSELPKGEPWTEAMAARRHHLDSHSILELSEDR